MYLVYVVITCTLVVYVNVVLVPPKSLRRDHGTKHCV